MESGAPLSDEQREILRGIGIRGRLAFALHAAERLLPRLDALNQDFRDYLEALWRIVETDDLMGADAALRTLPANEIFLAAEDGDPLPERYAHLHPDVPILLNCLVWIGTGEFFGSVTGHASESCDLTLRVADICIRHGVPPPPVEALPHEFGHCRHRACGPLHWMAAQRGLAELVDSADSAWPEIARWIEASRLDVDVLPARAEDAERTLLALQVTTRSALGAVAYETGGLVIDHGWLRLLGAGTDRLRGLLAWNGGDGHLGVTRAEGALVVGHDAAGGFFAINGGGLPGPRGTVCYFAPDTLACEDLGRGYADFLNWALTGDLATFYADLRWPGWEQEVQALGCDQGVSFYPPLWAQGPPLAERSRRTVPMAELWSLQHDVARQVSQLANGTKVMLEIPQD